MPGTRPSFCSNRGNARLPKIMASAHACFTPCAAPYAPPKDYPVQTASRPGLCCLSGQGIGFSYGQTGAL